MCQLRDHTKEWKKNTSCCSTFIYLDYSAAPLSAASFRRLPLSLSSAPPPVPVIASSEAAPCPLQPFYFDKWDIFADTLVCQYAMGLPVCIFNNLLPIFPILCHLFMSEWDSPIFEKFVFSKIRIPFHLYFSVFSSNLVCNNLLIILFFMPPTQAVGLYSMGLTINCTNEFVQSHFSDGDLNPISNPTPPWTHPNWSGQPGVP
jgi:hypothetical protein